MFRTVFVVLLAAPLAACESQPRPAAPAPPNTTARAPAPRTTSSTAIAPPTPSPNEAGGSFGFSRVHESCNSFSAHITNPSKTAWLDVYVDVKTLGLGPGEHLLPVDGKSVRLAITELPRAYEGEWSCTDIGGGPPSEVTARWRATSGNLRILLRKPAPDAREQPYDGPFDRVDVALEAVHFIDDTGRSRAVTVHFDALRIGWMPG